MEEWLDPAHEYTGCQVDLKMEALIHIGGKNNLHAI